MRRVGIAVVLACLAFAFACGSSTSAGTEREGAEALPESDASADVWQSPPALTEKTCHAFPTYADCHVCCLRAHPKSITVIWEAFRACACKKPVPRLCEAECGTAYCGDSFPVAKSTIACRRCLGDTFGGRDAGPNEDCAQIAAEACLPDNDCYAGVMCGDGCPPIAPGEDEDVIEQRLIDDGGIP